MMLPVKAANAPLGAHEINPADRDHPLLEKLIDRLPDRMRASTHWLRRPSSRWIRIPTGVLLVFGGLLSVLPLLGLWMLPLGLFLLAEDMPPLRRARSRILGAIQRHRPQWFVSGDAALSSNAASRPDAVVHSGNPS
jgi:hypothetical protein